MMPLAMILAGRGAHVAGSDRSLDQGRIPAKFDDLRARGVTLFPQDGSGITSRDQLVIASAAVEDSVADIVAANRWGCVRATRAEILSDLFNDSRLPIGIAGTSGKSTVTGMVGWILHACGRDPTVMNGAVMKNFAGPDAPFASALVGGNEVFVSEVDESDGSIARYRPRIAVLNNVSLDHKSLAELRLLFAGFIAKAETAIVNIDNDEAAALAAALPPERVHSVALDRPADFAARDIEEAAFGSRFTLCVGGNRKAVTLQVPGRHNIANALAAIAASVAAGVTLADAVAAIADFAGLRRRFDLVGIAGEGADAIAVIDDFGHNPDKIAATLDTLRAFPGRVLILFQPHGYGPLAQMRRELGDAFADRMRAGDLLVLPDPAYFGGTTTRTVGSDALATDIAARGHDVRHIPDRADAAATIAAAARPGDRIIVMGARDDTLSLLAADILDQVRHRRGD